MPQEGTSLHPKLKLDVSDWGPAHEEFERLKAAGLPPEAAVLIFEPLLRVGFLREAAQLMIDSHSKPKAKEKRPQRH